jgi:hypothetical protein
MLAAFKLLQAHRSRPPPLDFRQERLPPILGTFRVNACARGCMYGGTNARVSEIDFRIRRFNHGRGEKSRMIAKYH